MSLPKLWLFEFRPGISAGMGCVVIDHPLVKVRVTALRDKRTGHEAFRQCLKELSVLVACEATRDLACEPMSVLTPLGPCGGHRLARPLILVPILRAGLGMADGMLSMLPDAVVGHIGLARDEQTLQPLAYYVRLPPALAEADVLVVDPMLATGNSAVNAISKLKAGGARRIRLVSLVGCPAGIQRVEGEHPDVPIYLTAIDDGLNGKGYIVPGLGDAGDRYFGT